MFCKINKKQKQTFGHAIHNLTSKRWKSTQQLFTTLPQKVNTRKGKEVVSFHIEDISCSC